MSGKTGCMGMIFGVFLGLVLGGFGLWHWAVANSSAGLLDRIDAAFPRSHAVAFPVQARYAPDPAQRVELWVPEGTPPSGGWPLVAFIHGGGWHSGAPQDYRFVARTLGEHGYATALVGYRLVPQGKYPAMLQDSAAGIAWIRSDAGKYGVDAKRFALMGHSAGAYNVLMLALDPEWLAKAGVPQSAIEGVVSLAGPTDFYPFTSDSARNAFGEAPDPKRTQPITFARADAPPILLLQGAADETVRPKNARNLAAALRAKGGVVEEREFAGMSHAGIIMALSKPFAQGDKVLDPILAFLGRVRADHPEGSAQASVPVQAENR
ncbi:alpha/beta hydrolase [Tsuneonella mangrovi]|uniref:alpha/beta hydrolase n=1 Tax=Tsuneonella mangrovi TaxID=1982042 RepID=UPI000BA241E3|nr:alpha/beta hydrolase [Tsuneonella mangrovi]